MNANTEWDIISVNKAINPHHTNGNNTGSYTPWNINLRDNNTLYTQYRIVVKNVYNNSTNQKCLITEIEFLKHNTQMP